MLPARTNSPPKRFTPRYCAFELRPLREEPTPFLCAMVSSADLHVLDLHFRERLPVAGVPSEPRAAREPVDLDLLVLAVPHHLGRHLRPSHGRLPGVHVLAVARQENLVEGNLAPGIGLEQRHLDRDPRLGPELAAAGGEDDVSHEGRNSNRRLSFRQETRDARWVMRDGQGRIPHLASPISGYATAYCSVTSRPAGLAIIRNSSSRIIGSSRTSSSSPVCFSNCFRKSGSCSTRYSATSGCSRTANWCSLWSAPARLSERSMRRTTTSGRNTRPVPVHVGHSAVIDCHSEGRTRWRVISMSPSSETANALVRARSRPRCVRSSWSTLSRLPRVSMSMKSTTMIPPMSRSRSWRATSRAASRLVFRMVFSGSFFPV